MVSEITRFYCQPDMTSSWFPRQGALLAIFHDDFLESNHDFLIGFHSNFLLEMQGFQDTRFYCQLDMTSSSVLRQGALCALFHDGFWKIYHDILIMSHSNFLSGMHGFGNNEVLLQAGYDVIVISPPGGASRDLSWRILNERLWLPGSVP